MKILITGGAGFIGSHTADRLIEQGHQVRLLDNLQPTVHPRGKPDYLHPEAEFIKGDVQDANAWKAALPGVEAVYHLAAYQDYLTDFSTFFHINAASTALLYEILVSQAGALKVNKVIVAASQAVMGEGRYKCPSCFASKPSYIYPDIRLESQLAGGDWEHRCPQCRQVLQWLPSDETVINPCNPYALSKHSQEQIAIQLGRRYDIPSVVMRYSIVQGPRQSFYNAYSGAMRIFALSLLLDRPPTIYEDGLQIRDFVNIDDVVDANVMVLENSDADFKAFNVGGGKAWTVRQFYDTLQKIAGKQLPPKIEGTYRYGDTRHIFSDTSRLGRLGWSPKRDVANSIEAYWQWLTTHRQSNDILAYAEQQMRRLNVIRSVKDKS
jgi:dTDP-L-rhamnose 4-epimerase